VSQVLVQFVMKLDMVWSREQFRLQWLSEQRQLQCRSVKVKGLLLVTYTVVKVISRKRHITLLLQTTRLLSSCSSDRNIGQRYSSIFGGYSLL